MESSAYTLLVGLDWARETHQVCVVGSDAVVIENRSVAHEATAIHSLIDSLLDRVDTNADHIAVAIETPRGSLIDALLERGLHVYALNPKQLDRFRDRHGMSGAKDDRLDAYVLADALRCDLHKFRRVQPDSALVLQIRELSRADDELREEINRLSNRLQEQVYRCASHLIELCPASNEPWFWELVERVGAGKRVSSLQAQKLLKRHRIRRIEPDLILRALARPVLRGVPGAREAAWRHIQLLIPRLRLVHEQRKGCLEQLQSLLDEFAAEDEARRGAGPGDMAILRSLPGVGLSVATTLVAEAASLLRARDYRGLRAFSGIAPVTKRSGKSCSVSMRYGCNGRLRTGLYHWARTSVQHDSAARAYYATLRERGHSHGRALRSVADRWLRILTAMLNARTLYDRDHGRVPAAA